MPRSMRRNKNRAPSERRNVVRAEFRSHQLNLRSRVALRASVDEATKEIGQDLSPQAVNPAKGFRLLRPVQAQRSRPTPRRIACCAAALSEWEAGIGDNKKHLAKGFVTRERNWRGRRPIVPHHGGFKCPVPFPRSTRIPTTFVSRMTSQARRLCQSRARSAPSHLALPLRKERAALMPERERRYWCKSFPRKLRLPPQSSARARRLRRRRGSWSRVRARCLVAARTALPLRWRIQKSRAGYSKARALKRARCPCNTVRTTTYRSLLRAESWRSAAAVTGCQSRARRGWCARTSVRTTMMVALEATLARAPS